MDIEEKVKNIEERLLVLEEKNKGLLEVNDKLIHENISLRNKIDKIPKDTPVLSKIEEGLVMEDHNEKSFKILGKTFPHRSILRENGGSWNKSLQVWIFPIRGKEPILEIFKKNGIEIKIK